MAHGAGARKNEQRGFSGRRFERHSTLIDGRPIGCHTLHCSTPGCGKPGELLDRTDNGYPPKFIIEKMTQKGWFVGPDSRTDLCPSCYKTELQARRERRGFKAKPITLAVVEPTAAKIEETTMVSNGVEAPAAMTRMDRRIIHAKLEEVYADEETGYRDNWTDMSVAKNLGQHIPVAWVAMVREEAFGPAKDNGEIRDMLSRVVTAASEANFILEECKKQRVEVSSLVESTNALMKRAAEIGKTLDGLIIIADRIEKSVRS